VTLKKVLCINLGFGGGCVYYANSLIKNMHLPKEVWENRYSEEPSGLADVRICMGRGKMAMLWQTPVVLPFYLLKALFRSRKVGSVIVFGPGNWDIAFIGLFRFLSKRTLYVVHDGIMHVGDGDKVHQRLLSACMKRATDLVFLSRYVKNTVENNLKINKPSVILPHGIIRYGNTGSIVKELPLHPVFTMIGRINYYKGINLLLDALPLLDFARIGRIVVAGEVSGSIKIPECHEKLFIDNRWLTTEDFDRYVRETDFLLMPYLEASQSGIAAVSIGYAKPAVATKVGAMTEQFTDHGAFFMKDVTAESLADAIMSASIDRARYSEIQAELVRLSGIYSWPATGNRLAVYLQQF
jgi:glycosyltransferase involved in cell wall biosynthesis